MTVESSTARITQVSDGVTLVFNFNFLVLDASHIVAYLDGDESNPLSGYTVGGIGVQTGGNIVFTVAPAAGNLTIARIIPKTQLIDYIAYGKFPAESTEQGFDNLTMLIQELNELYQRSMLIRIDETSINNLPTVTSRANKYLGFDAQGQPTAIEANPPDLSPPIIGTGDAGKILQINQAENNYEIRRSMESYDTDTTINLQGAYRTVIRHTNTADRTIWFPNSTNSRPGDEILIFRDSVTNHDLTLNQGSGVTINGGLNYVINQPNCWFRFVLDATFDWRIIDSSLRPAVSGYALPSNRDCIFANPANAISFSVSANIAAAFESVGDSLSGAQNIWPALDVVPNGAKWIGVKIYGRFVANASVIATAYLYYNNFGAADTINVRDSILRAEIESAGTTGRNQQIMSYQKIPVDNQGKRFELRYDVNNMASTDLQLHLIDFGV
ncbi:MAG: hypothetical protein DWQ49_09895 [Bacteroidetes bacterium]|nr:MAG: hypothetical protein DWQ49_09895 [Bacteroidota bacterium]